MDKKYECRCGATFSRVDLSGMPRTHCPICRAAIGAETSEPQLISQPVPVSSQAPAATSSDAQPPPFPFRYEPRQVANSAAAANASDSDPFKGWLSPRFGYGVGAAFFLPMAIIFAILGIYERRKAAASENWPSVTGTVVAIDMARHANVGKFTQQIESYDVKVQYTYVVNGQLYWGKKIGLESLPQQSWSAQETMRRYAVGSTPLVYYDPNNPSEALLERGYSGGETESFQTIFFVVIPASFALVGSMMLAASLLHGRGQPLPEKQ